MLNEKSSFGCYKHGVDLIKVPALKKFIKKIVNNTSTSLGAEEFGAAKSNCIHQAIAGSVCLFDNFRLL